MQLICAVLRETNQRKHDGHKPPGVEQIILLHGRRIENASFRSGRHGNLPGPARKLLPRSESRRCSAAWVLVLDTPVKNRPSKCASLVWRARSQTAAGGTAIKTSYPLPASLLDGFGHRHERRIAGVNRRAQRLWMRAMPFALSSLRHPSTHQLLERNFLEMPDAGRELRLRSLAYRWGGRRIAFDLGPPPPTINRIATEPARLLPDRTLAVRWPCEVR
jgi:hypothetical protein